MTTYTAMFPLITWYLIPNENNFTFEPELL